MNSQIIQTKRISLVAFLLFVFVCIHGQTYKYRLNFKYCYRNSSGAVIYDFSDVFWLKKGSSNLCDVASGVIDGNGYVNYSGDVTNIPQSWVVHLTTGSSSSNPTGSTDCTFSTAGTFSSALIYESVKLTLPKSGNACGSDLYIYFDATYAPYYSISASSNTIACKGGAIQLQLGNSEIYSGYVNLQVSTNKTTWFNCSPIAVSAGGLITVYDSNLPQSVDFYDKSLTFRILLPDNTGSSTTVSNCFFLKPINLTIAPTQPTCYGDNNATVEISGFPANSSGKQLRINLCQLANTKVSDSFSDVYYIDPQTGRSYYWNDQATMELPISSDKITLTNLMLAEKKITLKAGMYKLETFYDDVLCKSEKYFDIKEPDSIGVSPLAPVVISSETNSSNETINYHIASNGGSGSATLTITGRTDTNYTLVNAPNGATFVKPSSGYTNYSITGLTAGEHSIRVQNGTCLSNTENVTLVEPEKLSFTRDSVDVKCYGESTGSISFKITGGRPPFNVELKKGTESISSISNLTKRSDDGNIFKSLPAETYNLYVTDANGATPVKSSNIVIHQPATQLSLTTTVSKITWPVGADDGKVILSAEGGTGAYTYLYRKGSDSPSSVTSPHSNLDSGTYHYTVTDVKGCTDSESIALNYPPALNISSLNTKKSTCASSDGQLKVTISGGWPDDYDYVVDLYKNSDKKGTYTFNKGVTTREYTFTGLKAGSDYKLEGYVKDKNSNKISVPNVVVEMDNPISNVTISSLRKASCLEKSDGEVTINNLPATGTYTLSGGGVLDVSDISNKKITGLKSGSYTLTLTETTNQCEQSIKVTPTDVNVYNDPITFKKDVIQPSCAGVSNGTITLNVTSNNTQYFPKLTYAIDGADFGNATSFSVTNGTHKVEVKYVEGCVYEEYVTVTPKDNLFQFDAIPNSETCDAVDDGKIEIKNISYNGDKPIDVLLYNADTNPEVFKKGKTNITTNEVVVLEDLSHGKYSITIKDGDGCFLSKPVTIDNANHAPVIAITEKQSLACAGAHNGIIEVTASTVGYTSNSYDFFLSGQTQVSTESVNSTTYRFSGLNNNLYTIIVKDDKKCPGELKDQTVSVSSSPVKLDVPVITPASCKAAKNGKIQISAADGKRFSYGYKYSIDISGKPEQKGVSALFTLIESGKTPYSVTVTDSAGCTSVYSNILVDEIQNPFTINEIHSTAATCHDSINGTISFTAADWKEGLIYDYVLTDKSTKATQKGSITTSKIPNVKGSTYTVELLSPDQCPASADVKVVNPEVMNVSYATIKVADKGDATGQIIATITGGSGNYEYQCVNHDNKVQSPLVSGTEISYEKLPADQYQLSISDANGCRYFEDAQQKPISEWSRLIPITEPEKSLTINPELKHITCNGTQDGRITINGTGGWHDSGSYLYRLGNSGEWGPTNSFPITKGGDYEVQIKDVIDGDQMPEVTRKAIVHVDEPLPFSLNAAHTKDATCNGLNNGWIKTTTNNGIADQAGLFHYWLKKKDGSIIETRDAASTYYYGHLPVGEYKLVVADSHLCRDSTQLLTIKEPVVPVISSRNNYIRVFGESTGYVESQIAHGSNYFQYQWLKQGVATPLLSGNSTGTLRFDNLPAGDYRVLIKDTANCKYEGNEWMERKFSIKAPQSALELHALQVDSVKCFGEANGVIKIEATGGWGDYRYRLNQGGWSPSTQYTGLIASDYLVDVVDSAGVTFQQTIKVSEPKRLEASLLKAQNDSCYRGGKGFIALNISGGNVPYWVSTNNTAFEKGNTLYHLKEGNYTMYVHDAKQCATQTGPVTLLQPSAVVPRDLTITQSRCSNKEGSIVANFEGGTGGLNYKWQIERILNDGTHPLKDTSLVTPSIYQIPSGSYHLTVSDANRCIFPFTFNVGDITDLSIASIETDSVSCFGYSDGWARATVVKGNPDYLYLWPENKATVYQSEAYGYAANQYSLLVRDSKGCNTTKDFTIATPAPISYQISQVEQPLCLGGQQGVLDLKATGGTPLYGYQWLTGQTGRTLTNVAPGKYTLVISDSHLCKDTFDFPMAYQRVIKPTLGPDANICHYNALQLDAGDYSRYQWQSSNGFKATTRRVVLKDPGAYYLEVSDADNCLGYDTLQMNVSYLKIDKLTSTDITCYGFGDGTASVEVSPVDWPHTYWWSPGQAKTASVNHLQKGNYYAMVYDDYGCGDTLAFQINEPAALALTSKVSDPLCWGVADGQISITPSGGKGGYLYQWAHGATTSKISKLDKGSYTLNLTDANGCLLQQRFDLAYQRAINVELGADRTICKGNQVKLYPGWYNGYRWYNNSTELSRDTAIVINGNANISLTVNDESGCLATDQVKVIQSAAEFAPLFLTASSVAVGDTLLLIEVSQPKPQDLKWNISLPHKVVEETGYSAKVIFEETGVAEVKLTANNGSCLGESWKEVLVVADSGESPDPQPTGGAISRFSVLSVSPNPSSGQFSAQIKLKEAASVKLYLVNLGTGQLTETRQLKGLDAYNEPFSIVGSGHYALFAESGGERRVVKLIVY